jgi:hypothetical protein
MQRLSGLFGQAEDFQRVGQKCSPAGTAASFIAAGKQLHAQLFFQLVNAGGDIGLRPPQPLCRAGDARSCATVLKISNVVWFIFILNLKIMLILSSLKEILMAQRTNFNRANHEQQAYAAA